MKIKKALENLCSFYLNWVILSAEKMRSEEVMKKRKKIKKKSEKQEIPVCLKLHWVIFAK